jgi:hypothetical protein
MGHSTFLVVTLGLCACAEAPCPEPAAPDTSGQSYREAIALMCDVDRRAGIDETTDPLERAGIRSDYIQTHVKNADGIEYRTYFSVKPSTDQAKSLDDEAKGVGITRCALASTLRQEG